MKLEKELCAIKGAGDLGTGVAIRLVEAGFPLIMTEIAKPRMVRRAVSFGDAVYQGHRSVLGIEAVLCSDLFQVQSTMQAGAIPVVVDPEFELAARLSPKIIVDARMAKRYEPHYIDDDLLIIGLGPGFVAGENCHAVIETNRGSALGSIIWQGKAEEDTKIPSEVLGLDRERVYLAQSDGVFTALAEIGEILDVGKPIGKVDETVIPNRFKGVLRGCLHSGLTISLGEKLADVDPRLDPSLAFTPSDKALCVGDAVVRAVDCWFNKYAKN